MTDPHDCTYNKQGYCTWEQSFCPMTEPMSPVHIALYGEMWCWMELQSKRKEKRCESKR